MTTNKLNQNQDYHDTPWHSLTRDELQAKLDIDDLGLNQDEVDRRRLEFGLNVLPTEKSPGLFKVFFRQFLNPLIYVLLLATLVSIALQKYLDSVFVMAVIVLNAIIGTWQELKAQRNADSLKSLMKIQVEVIRNGEEVTIDADELVPGDRVKLESGSKVPADIRLLQCHNIKVDESLLTGESIASEKQSSQAVPLSEPLIAQSNMLFAGTTILTGRAIGLVVRIGSRSEVGKIAEVIASSKGEKPPLIIRMEKFTKNISLIFLLACSLLLIVAIANGIAMADFFFLAVALAVSAIPEGLPVALTIALSVAAFRMSKRNVIIRRLNAVESLGSCTMIASDKTGTLTINQQTAKLITLPDDSSYQILGLGYNGKGKIKVRKALELDKLSDLILAGALNNEAELLKNGKAWRHHGDSIDVAFLALAIKAGYKLAKLKKQYLTLESIPYESENKYSAVKVKSDKKTSLIYVKGASKEIIEMCSQVLVDGELLPIDPVVIDRQVTALASKGYRVIALAKKIQASDRAETLSPQTLQDLTFLGLVGFIDPLRPESKTVVKKCLGAGVEVAMITGDHPATALSICKQLGIARHASQVMTGEQIEQLGQPDSPEFFEKIAKCRVFAQVSPLQKLTIVDAFMKLGHFVAVTGDGVNDAPALKRANLGVAMGSGTDVAKESASMIVIDDNFSSIVTGIEEGRFAYDNVRKVIYLLITTGFAEIILFIMAIFIGLPLPLLAVQLLWLNLVTNGIQHIALAFEAGEPGAMSRKPRSPQEGIFNPLMVQQTLLSGFVIGSVALLAWAYMIHTLQLEEYIARNFLFSLMILFENMHVLNCRSEYRSIFSISLFKNKMLIFGILGAQLIHLSAMYIPWLSEILGIQPIPFSQWLILLLISSSIIISSEIFKLTKKFNSKN